MKEWPAAASVLWATREHRESIWESGSCYIPVSNPPPLFRLCHFNPQSFKPNAPETLVLIKAAGVCDRAEKHSSMPSLHSAEASLTAEAEVTGDQAECTLSLFPSCSHAAHVLSLTRPCYGLVLLMVMKVK